MAGKRLVPEKDKKGETKTNNNPLSSEDEVDIADI